MKKGIYKRGSIYWIRYAGLDGRIIYESSGSSRFKDAETLLLKQRQTISEGKQPEVRKKIPNVTFKELAKEYIVWAERQRGFKPKAMLIAQLETIFGNYQLRHFNSRLLEQYQTERMLKGFRPGKKGNEPQGNKPATINRHIATLKHMFTKAVEWELVEEEVLKKVRRVKLLQESNRRLRYLSNEECQELVRACSSHLRPIVITALNTGMRRGEILSLKWANVDLKNGFILLEEGMTKNGQRREIPINETLRTTLTGLTRRLDLPYVFYNPVTEKPYSDTKNSFDRACRKAKITNFRFHDLRHCFASHLVMKGIDITTVKELLGHKTLTMTLRYAHLAPSHKVKAVELLDSVLNEPTIQKLYNLKETLDDRDA